MIYESFLEKMGMMWTLMGLARFLHFFQAQGTDNWKSTFNN
jgi:hypothetical protein